VTSINPRTASAALARVGGALKRRLGGQADEPHYRGAFATYAEALAAVRPDKLAGYDNEELAEISFDRMCQIALWDYPVLFWLDRLLPETQRLVDAGGHMGTKFRAFRSHLRLPATFDWAVYDVPAIIRAGRARAERDGLSGISFYERLEDTPPADLLLASGLMQYLDIPFEQFLARLPTPPKHIIFNKVATREGPTIVTLESFGVAEVPYQVRDRAAFIATLDSLGYNVEDSWTIPSLSRAHATFGKSTSRGFYMRKRS